jgi:hypothetical protein
VISQTACCLNIHTTRLANAPTTNKSMRRYATNADRLFW